MKKQPFLIGRVTCIVGALALLAACLPLSAVAVERVVLGEEFTATW